MTYRLLVQAESEQETEAPDSSSNPSTSGRFGVRQQIQVQRQPVIQSAGYSGSGGVQVGLFSDFRRKIRLLSGGAPTYRENLYSHLERFIEVIHNSHRKSKYITGACCYSVPLKLSKLCPRDRGQGVSMLLRAEITALAKQMHNHVRSECHIAQPDLLCMSLDCAVSSYVLSYSKRLL